MTATEALAALVEAVRGVHYTDELSTALAQAQAVLAQEEQAPPSTDPIERLKAALRPASHDPTPEALAERIVSEFIMAGGSRGHTLRLIILRAIQETPR